MGPQAAPNPGALRALPDAGATPATALAATLALAAATLCACASPGSGAPSAGAEPASSSSVALTVSAPPSAAASPSALADPAPSDSASSAASATAGSAASAAPATSAAASAPAGPCPEGMIQIGGGTLKPHKPGRHAAVEVATFCLDRAEVTVLAYKACVREKKCSPRCLEIGRCTAVPSDADWPDPVEAVRASTFCNGTRSDRDDHPVNCISYDEAKGYCEARDRRLPTGHEWEWAAVASKPVPIFPWGQPAPTKDEMCWGHPWKRPSTCLPGSYAKDVTRDGVVDMAGNLSEWVTAGTPAKPRRQLRGASWYAIDDGYVEAALWGFESTSQRSEVFGFRCAR